MTGGGKVRAAEKSGPAAPPVQELARAIASRHVIASRSCCYRTTEIRVYEPRLGPDGQMEWNEIAYLSFNRDYVGSNKTTAKFIHPLARHFAVAWSGSSNTADNPQI